MPTYVDPDECDGYRALGRAACMYLCPIDSMALDSTIGQAYDQEPDPCWECYSGVKICPNSAIDMRGGADVMPMGAALKPVRGTHSIIWTANFRAEISRGGSASRAGCFMGAGTMRRLRGPHGLA